MRKILHINSYASTGSIGRIIDQINKKASLSGWDTYVASGVRYSSKSSKNHIVTSTRISEYLHYCFSLLTDRQGHGSYVETLLLIRKIKEVHPDLIHLHNLHGYYLNYTLLFNFLIGSKIPVVWTFHDCWNFTGHCVHFDYVACDKWSKEGCHDCMQNHSYPRSLFIDNSQVNFEKKKFLFTQLPNLHIVTVSDWLKQVVEKSFFKGFPITRIYNGIDLEVFKFNPLHTLKLHEDCEFVLLGVSVVWTARKGFQDYIRLRSFLPKKYKIVLIGLTDKQIASLPDGIVGLPRTTDVKELVDYYSAADVVLNLSYEETMGMSTVEGLACGKPVIVYDRTASPELITAATGRVVEAGNISVLAREIETVCSSKSSFLSSDCRQHAAECFDKDICYDQYIHLYNQLVPDSK